MRSIRLNIVNYILPILPETRCFKMKCRLLRWAGAKIGENVRICSSVRIYGTGELIIGDSTWIGHQCILISTSKISIGSYVDIAPRVYIGTGTHFIDKDDNKRTAGQYKNLDVSIEEGAWICASCTILPGITIGKKSVIGAGAIVSSDVPNKVVSCGIPSKIIKNL